MSHRNIILITIDALRASDVGCIGGGNLTPNIDLLAKESLLFTEAISNGPGTPQSFPSIFASVYPLMNDKLILSKRYITLAQVLQENGFLTVGFHSNPFLSNFFGYNRGFQVYQDLFNNSEVLPRLFKGLTQRNDLKGLFLKPVNKIISNKFLIRNLKRVSSSLGYYSKPYAEGELINSSIFEWITKRKKIEDRFFFWVHYMDPHEPYNPPNPWSNSIRIKKKSSIDKQSTKQLYDAEIKYVDFCIGNLIKTFYDWGLLQDTMIILTSDHGEAFNEHGEFGHGHILYDELIRVPLIINGIDQRNVVDKQIGLLNLSPIILENLGINKPKTFLGNNWASTEAVISESAIFNHANYNYDYEKKIISYRTKKWKLIINDIEGKTELYNLERDPEEQENVSDWNKDIEKDFTQQIKNHICRLSMARIDITRDPLNQTY